MENLLTVNDVAAIFSCSPSTIYSWAETGQIPSYKIGKFKKMLRFRLSEVENFVSSAKIKTVSIKKFIVPSKNQDIDSIVNKAIASLKGKGYNGTNKKGNKAKASPIRKESM